MSKLGSVLAFAAGFMLGTISWLWHTLYWVVIITLSVFLYLKW